MRLIYITLAWVLGISLARALPDIETIYWIGALVACALSLAVTRSKQTPGKVLLLLLILAAGGARQSLLPRTSDIAAHNGYSGTVTGVVVEDPATVKIVSSCAWGPRPFSSTARRLRQAGWCLLKPHAGQKSTTAPA